MPRSLSTWIARIDCPALDIRRGDAVTMLQSEFGTEITVHRSIAATAEELAALAREGLLDRATLDPSSPTSAPDRSPRVLTFGVLTDRRRSTAQTG